MDPYDAFVARACELVAGDRMEKAKSLTERYWTEPFTGQWFHLLADDSHPNEITAQDLIAVSTLNVTVPAGVSIWLLSNEGNAAVTELLTRVPVDVELADGGDLVAEGSALWQLWDLLSTACWPTPTTGNDMGRTKISKLMAAKRPRLVPIYDSVVSSLFPPVPNYWHAFSRLMSNDQGRLMMSIASVSGAPEDVTFLRRLDALFWMIGREQDW